MSDNKKSSTTPKKLSNKEIREARKARLKEEKIPAGMRAEDYADAAFRKKVTIIMGSILLVFIIGVIAVVAVVAAVSATVGAIAAEEDNLLEEE